MTPSGDIESLLQAVQAEYLRRMNSGHGALLRQVEHYVTSRSGKMLRPRMLLTAAATLGAEHLYSRRTLLLAVCVEMLHNASLLHDDVIDRADSRRGRPSVNARFGNAAAVLVGDYHFSQIMQLLDEAADSDATRKLNAVVMSMVEAELLQQEQSSLDSSHWSQDTYLQIIDGKTANLFALAAELGNPAYRDFGLHYGRLFQLRDDLADGEASPYTEQLIAAEQNAINQMDAILNI